MRTTAVKYQQNNDIRIKANKLREEFLTEYLLQLDEHTFYQKYIYYTKWTERSNIFFFSFQFLLKVFSPKSALPTREFVFWAASRIKQTLGDLHGAKNICRKYLKTKKSNLLEQQLSDLCETSEAFAFVSVIVPTYNRPLLLKEALESLTKQTFKKIEVIIINNGTISVNDVVNLFIDKLDITLLNSEVSGSVSHARNIGIKNAKGNYIAFLDDDDWYYPEHLEIIISEMKRGNYLITYTDALVEFQEEINGKLQTIKKFVYFSRDFNKKLILVKDYIFPPCIILNKKCFDLVGYFDENLKTDEDMDLWIRMSKYYKFTHIKKLTCSVRKTNSVSSLTKDWDLMYKSALYLYHKHRALTGNNVFVLLGQFYYLNLRKRRAKKYQNSTFKYNF